MPIKSFLIAFNYNLKYFHLAHFQMCIIFYPSHFLFQIVQRRNSLKAKSYHFFVFLIFLFLLGQFIIGIPEKNIVIVRLGHNQGKKRENTMHSEITYAIIDEVNRLFP